MSTEESKATNTADEVVKKEEPTKVSEAARKEKSNLFDFNVGFFSINDKGMTMKPKFDFGASIGGSGAYIGLGDVRDGINIGTHIDVVSQTVKGSGKDMEEFLRSLEFTGRIAEILDDTVHLNKIIHFFTDILAEISRRCKIGTFHVAHIEGTCTGKIGSSIGAGLSLGWKDEEKYRMLGASGTLAVGGEYRAGLHESKTKIKTIFKLSMAGVSFRFVIYARRKNSDEIPPVSIEKLIDQNILVDPDENTVEPEKKIQENKFEEKTIGLMRKVSDLLGVRLDRHLSSSSSSTLSDLAKVNEVKKQYSSQNNTTNDTVG